MGEETTQLLRLWDAYAVEAKVVAFLVASALAGLKLFAKQLSYLAYRLAFRRYKDFISFEQLEVRTALRGYVRHEFMSIDPSTKMDMADALAVKKSDLFKALDRFLSELGHQKFLFIFADCGMGKTTFLINYFHRRMGWVGRRGFKFLLISLSKPGYENEIGAVSLSDRKRTVILMDAFDEDALVLEGVGKRLAQLIEMTSSFKAVVITCRSQFFSSDSEIPLATGALRTGATPAGMSKEYEFERFYIAPFDRRKIGQYLRRTMPGPISFFRRKRAARFVDRVPSLSMRPMLLAHLADVLEISDRSEQMSLADIYQAIVSAWAKRESHWLAPLDLLNFSQRLALDLFDGRHARGGEFCSREEVIALAKEWNIDIRPDLLTGRSLLNRLDDGRCKFAHRSILEYFVAEGIIAGASPRKLELTDQIIGFLFDRLNVDQSALIGRLGSRSTIELAGAENRLGYSTNFNLLHLSDEIMDPGSICRAEIIDALGRPSLLGEHLQAMVDLTDPLAKLIDVRISLSGDSREGGVDAFLSVWSSRDAVLSQVLLTGRLAHGLSMGNWSSRRTQHLVGNFRNRGVGSAEFHAATFCGGSSDFLGVDSANSCSVISAGFDGEHGCVRFRFIAGFVERGPLAPFGILKGGSRALFSGKKFALIKARGFAQEDASFPARDIVHEKPIVAPAERWGMSGARKRQR